MLLIFGLKKYLLISEVVLRIKFLVSMDFYLLSILF
jgi:hypothetical protein